MAARARESQLQKELKQSKPFSSATQEAVVALFRTTDMVKRATAGAVEPHGITLQQYNVLRILRGAGKEGLPTLAIVFPSMFSADTALRLSRYFGTSEQFWSNLQSRYNLELGKDRLDLVAGRR